MTRLYIVDIGIACTGTQEIPRPQTGVSATPTLTGPGKNRNGRRLAPTPTTHGTKSRSPAKPRSTDFAQFYEAEILHLIDGAPFDAAVLPDSFTVRLKISGKGLKDFVLNYPYVFEVVEPEDIACLSSGW